MQHVLELGHTFQPIPVRARLRELCARTGQLARVRAQHARARRRVAVAALPAALRTHAPDARARGPPSRMATAICC